ncbi:MAG TPA: hypothetical protein DCS93_29740 [Microscillaceae bacterium]|nr:hypothetical protein [Microscillaceae bacterium]
MLHEILKIKHLDAYVVIGTLILFGLIETFAGFLKKSRRTSDDWIQEAGSFLALSTLIHPLIVWVIFQAGHYLLPGYAQWMADWNLGVALVFYLLIDDLLQYWYHRSAHEYPFLWKLHRAHHQAEEMGYFVSYRNAALYFLLMPNIWWIGVVTFLGGWKALILGVILKQMVIISSHSTVKWDKPLYKNRLLRPIVKMLERIIITPAFHHKHHGTSKLEGGEPNHNFGNMFSIWDQLFGTAIFRDSFPTKYGLPRPTQDAWAAAYLYPFVKSKDEQSELASGYAHQDTTTPEPTMVSVKKGEKYLWCACGKSQSQPFCDGSHHGSKQKPVLFEAKRDGTVKFCNCKISKKGPFCDNSHEVLLEKIAVDKA